MVDPIIKADDPLEVPASEEELLLDPSYNPMLTAMLVSNLSLSSATVDPSHVDSAIPKLPTGDEAYRKMQLAWSKIMTSILDGWSENNREIEERRKEDQKKADRNHDQIKSEKAAKNKLAKTLDRNAGTIDPLTTRDIWQNGMASLFALYANEAEKAKGVDPTSSSGPSAIAAPSGTGSTYAGDLGGVQPSSTMTSALMIGAGFLGSFKTAEVSGAAQVDNKVLQDAWNQMAVGRNPNDPITQMAGWVSALWGIGLTYFTAAQQVGEIAASNKEPPKDLEFAVKYAENLIASLAKPEFMAQMQAIAVASTKSSEKVDPQQMERLGNLGKIILLTVALAQIMKLELGASFKDGVYEGHLTGEEVVAMLKGEINFQSNDPQGLAPIKARLVMQINILMDQLPAETRAALLGNMLTYFNTNPSVEKMSNINSVVGSVFSANDMGEKHLQQNRM